MSTAPYPADYPFVVSDAAVQHLASVGEAPGPPVRRRANVYQAGAIEKLGNAADHLIYSRMFLTNADAGQAETDAVHLLMMLRRNIFEECETVVRRHRQMKKMDRGGSTAERQLGQKTSDNCAMRAHLVAATL